MKRFYRWIQYRNSIFRYLICIAPFFACFNRYCYPKSREITTSKNHLLRAPVNGFFNDSH